MGNYYIDYQENYQEIIRIAQRLQDTQFPAWLNDKIMKDRNRLYEVYTYIVPGRTNSTAESKLRKLYYDWQLEFGGKDNWYAYTIADKLLIMKGITPKPIYEEDA